MDSLGITQPIIIPAASASPAPALPKHEAPVLPIAGSDAGGYEQQDAEQQRYQAVVRAASQIADIFVVSDKTFTIFKDVSGQYVTRFTSLRDGKVTYIPEPNLFRIGGESDRPVITIKA